MNVWPIPDALADAYKGTGHALAAVREGVMIDLIYLRDVIPDFDPDRAQDFLGDVRLTSIIQHLDRLGTVSIGLCSCWEFCEL